MTRKSNTKEEIRALFSRTGNQCAFPECVHPLVDDDDHFIAQVCHIEAAEKGGPRYNSSMTDEDRKSIKNLIVLCYRHHVNIDSDTDLYTVKCLQDMKHGHESNFSARPYMISDQVIDRISKEQMFFEHEISHINEVWQQEFDLAMRLNLSKDPSEHLNTILDNVSRIQTFLNELNEFLGNLPESIESFLDGLGYDLSHYRKIPYYENPFCNAFWEIMNIGMPNFLSFIRFHSKALEFHIEVQKLKEHPNDTSVRAKLEELKSQIRELASTSAHVD